MGMTVSQKNFNYKNRQQEEWSRKAPVTIRPVAFIMNEMGSHWALWVEE